MKPHDVGAVLKIDVTFLEGKFDKLKRLKTSLTQLQDALSTLVPPQGVGKKGGPSLPA